MSNKKHHEILLNKYELGRLLGRGTFAKVYYAKSLPDNSSVAIKVLEKPKIVKSGVAPMIIREVSALRCLAHHPNILRLHEVMATKSKIYLVMEHAKGGELFAHLARRGRLPEPIARRYFQQLIAALRFCHAHGIAHRDLKPENILLDHDGNLMLSDFGLSALSDHQRVDGLLHTTCGTPAYTAPEVIRRKGYDGAKADAWSCDVILYVLLAGFLPFDDSNLVTMYRRIQKREYQFPPWFSPSAKRVIYKLLDPNPATQITIDGLMDLPWIRRAYSLDEKLDLLSYLPPFPVSTTSSSFSFPPSMNAFDIISLSSGLNLSNLFEDGYNKRERKFTSMPSFKKIMDKIEGVCAKFGYVVEKNKCGVVGRGKWGVVISFEVSEVASKILLIELKVEGDCSSTLCWNELREEFGDLVFSWHKNEDL